MDDRNRKDRLQPKDTSGGNRKVEGICIGAIAGAVVGLTMTASLGYLGIAWGAGIGMVIGYFIGLNIKK